MEPSIRIGVGSIVEKDGLFLIGKRKGGHGEDTWSFPGGHLEFGETVIECVRRELLEEAGIEVTNIRLATYTDNIGQESGKHYLTLFMHADYLTGTVRTMEPDRCYGWEWYAWDALPKPLFPTMLALLATGYHPKH